MKKAILSLVLLLAGVSVYAQPAFGTKVYRDSNGIVLLKGDDGSWVILQGTGAPTLTTYIGESVPNKALYFNTSTAGAYSYSNGTWTLSSAGSASAIAPTTTAVTGCASKFLVADSGGLLQCPAGFAAFSGGGGGGVFTVNDTVAADGTTSFITNTGTFPTTPTGINNGFLINYTGAGSQSFAVRAISLNLLGGYTGSSATFGLITQNVSAGTGAAPISSVGNFGNYGRSSATTAGINVGTVGIALNGARNFGGYFFSQSANLNIGVVGLTTAGSTRIGGFFGATAPDAATLVSSGIQVDNNALAIPIAVFQDNSTTVTQIRDGGTIAGRDAVAGTDTDTAGGALTIGGGTGTGTGKGGSLVLQTTPSTTTGTTSLTPYDRVTFAAKAVALTDGATILFTVNTLGAHKRSGGTLEFTVQASDGTNDQVATGRTYWGAVDTTAGAGGETCTNLVDGLTISAAASGAASSGTLVITADATTGTDLCNFRITPAGSLSETTYNVYYWITKNLPDGAVSLP